MNVEELLELMEETLEAGTIVPFSASKRMVDVDRMRDIIDEVRNNLPDEIREQLMSQDIGKLPKPEEVQSLMQAFTAGSFIACISFPPNSGRSLLRQPVGSSSVSVPLCPATRRINCPIMRCHPRWRRSRPRR